MKSCLLFIITGFFNVSSFCQSPPAQVLKAFERLHPHVKNVKWEKEGANFEGSFRRNRDHIAVLFDPKGEILESEIEIPASALPKAARDYIEKKYDGKRIREASKTTESSGNYFYEVKLKDRKLLFDPSGHYLREPSLKTEEDDKK